ncbi:MAG TPA: cobalamin-binding protein [Gemmatimonadaceae bacterium]|nr:cobalamin-binding protein [Gemmatimonadaceae bacterium]
MRIVSLLPSATEIICAMGLEDQLVGVTHECDYPSSVRQLPKVTKTLVPTDATSAEIDALVRERLGIQSALYTLDMPVLERLAPDLIVTQALCDVCAVAEDEVRDAACRLPSGPRVLNLEPETLSEVLDCILDVGRATNSVDKAEFLVASLRARVDDVVARVRGAARRPRVALLEWIDPPFSTGHWNPELIRLAGGVDELGREREKSRTLAWSQVIDWKPDVVLISCCGFTAERTLEEVHVLDAVAGWDTVPAVQNSRVHVTDGSSYFSRPGPRLVDSLELLANVIHPDRCGLPSWVQPPTRLIPHTPGTRV